MNKRHKGFTLAELLVVMGIIVLFITLAVPAIRGLTGSSSISVARNQLAALITRAREEAVGIQDIRGVLFFVNPATDRVIGIIVQSAAIQDPNYPGMILLDAMPSRDSMPLPPGVRLQMIFNGVTAASSAAGTDDRYMGFNSNKLPPSCSVPGGVILFDGNGKLITRPYGFQLNQPTSVTGVYSPSQLCVALGVSTLTNYAVAYTDLQNASVGSAAIIPSGTPNSAIVSQLGLVLFSAEAFRAQGFDDLDSDLTAGQSYTSTKSSGASEQAEEAWLDSNSTPVSVNRFNGTLIRGE